MAHQYGYLTQNSREGMHELYYWAEAIDELPIFVPIVFEHCQVLLKKEEDGIGRVTALDLVGERIILEIYPSLLGVFVHSIED
jgi:hypothetical protein